MYQDDEYTIKQVAHGDELWPLLCPFAVSRKVRDELGIAISSDENYVWFFVLDSDNVVGFAAVEFCNGSKAKFRHAYVTEHHRGRGIYKWLLKAREDISSGKLAIIIVNNDTLEITSRLGYSIKNKRGKYTTLEKQL